MAYQTHSLQSFPFHVEPAEAEKSLQLLRDMASPDWEVDSIPGKQRELHYRAGRLITASCQPYFNTVMGNHDAIRDEDGHLIPGRVMNRVAGGKLLMVRPIPVYDSVQVEYYMGSSSSDRFAMTGMLPYGEMGFARQGTKLQSFISHFKDEGLFSVPADTDFIQNVRLLAGIVVDAIDNGTDVQP